MQAQRMPLPALARCLVIEDNLFDQKMIARAVAASRVALEVDFASTLEAARQLLAVHRYCIILCDNNLPDGSGSDFAQELANDPAHHDTRIIIVSGWPSPFMWAKAKHAGLQVIDKNDQPQTQLLDIISQRFGTQKLRPPPASVSELKPK